MSLRLRGCMQYASDVITRRWDTYRLCGHGGSYYGVIEWRARALRAVDGVPECRVAW